MGPTVQMLFTLALAVAGGVLLLYWIVCTFILLRGGDPSSLHKR